MYKLVSNNNKVIIYLIRHAESVANNYIKKNNYKEPYIIADPLLKSIDKDKYTIELRYKNANLSINGIEHVIKNRNKILEHIADVDMIVCSPMKRTLETCLITYNEHPELNKNIHLMSLVTEFGHSIENEGDLIEDLIIDPDILTSRHHPNIDYDELFLLHNNSEAGPWYNLNFRNDIECRVRKFKTVFSDKKYSQKRIVIFTHWGFIKELTGLAIDNYSMLKIELNQLNGSIRILKKY